MPLIKCETCKKDVADTAETCPHCGQEQPEKFLRQHPDRVLVCPSCNVNNYDNADECRNCGEGLYEALKEKWRLLEAKKAKFWSIVAPFAFVFIFFGVLSNTVAFLTGKFDFKTYMVGFAAWFVIACLTSMLWNLALVPFLQWLFTPKDKNTGT